MSAVFDFEEWHSFIELENSEEIYSLYQAVENVDEFGMFKCTIRQTSNGEQYIVQCTGIDEPLILKSEKARDAFLKFLERYYTKGEMTMDGWYMFRKAMEKDD